MNINKLDPVLDKTGSQPSTNSTIEGGANSQLRAVLCKTVG